MCKVEMDAMVVWENMDSIVKDLQVFVILLVVMAYLLPMKNVMMQTI